MMKTVHYLVALAILFSSAVLISFLPLGDTEREFAYITSVETKAEKVNSSHAKLVFQVSMEKSEDLDELNLTVKFFDASTNLLIYDFSRSVKVKGKYGVEEIKCWVKKSYDYRVTLFLERDGRIYSKKEISIYRLSQIPPDEEKIELVIKNADFAVINKSESEVRIRSTYYIESPETLKNLRFRIKAIQLESNLLVDDFWAERIIEAGKTNLIQFNMTLIDKYNYRIVLEVWSRNYVVDKREDVVKLNPEIFEEGEEKESFRVEDFIREELRRTPVPEYRPEYMPKAAPGFELILLLISGGGALWIMSRKRR